MHKTRIQPNTKYHNQINKLFEENKTIGYITKTTQFINNRKATQMKGIIKIHKAGSVSYTHLDVYKRQI